MSSLTSHRHKIDQVDEKIIKLLAERFALVEEVKSIKQATDHPFKDDDRWQQIKDRLDAIAEQSNLDPKGIQTIFDQIHKYALHYIYEV